MLELNFSFYHLSWIRIEPKTFKFLGKLQTLSHNSCLSFKGSFLIDSHVCSTSLNDCVNQVLLYQSDQHSGIYLSVFLISRVSIFLPDFNTSNVEVEIKHQEETVNYYGYKCLIFI